MDNRKKIAGIACAVALATALGATPALAAGTQNRNFVDADGDGICDVRGAVLTDATSSAIAGGYHRGQASSAVLGTGAGQGVNFVDADGDGICDNKGAGTGFSTNYVDANGDGVCDNAGSGMGLGRGTGSGYHGGRA